MAEYKYSVSEDTSLGSIDPGELHKSIAISLPVDFQGIKVEGDVLIALYANDLSVEDKTNLDATIGAHTGEPAKALVCPICNCKNYDPA